MRVLRRHAVRRRPRWGAAVVAALWATAILGVASGVLAGLVARHIVTPPRRKVEDVRVVAVDEASGTITFTRTAESSVAGRYGFWFADSSGYALIGPVLSESATTLTRALVEVQFGQLAPGVPGRFGAWYYLAPSDAGHRYEDVEIATEYGQAPAWLIPADDTDRWVIMVHGRGVVRAECIRAVSVFRDAGFTSLLVSYRNDGEAPASSDGRYALGDSEWRDVDAALGYALEHGAQSVVLMGWSMGGATVLQTLTRSSRAATVIGVVLDSPVIDWVRALDHHGKEQRLFRPVRWLVYRLLGGGWARLITGLKEPIDFARLDFVRRAQELSVPVLILHSDDDEYIPSTASHLLAEQRPDIVTLDAFTGAGHIRLWNYDEKRWTESIARWLAALPGTGSVATAPSVRTGRRRSPRAAE